MSEGQHAESPAAQVEDAVLGEHLTICAERLRLDWILWRDLTTIDCDILDTMRAAGARLQSRRSQEP